MSSYKQKQRDTNATRKRTQKRLRDHGLGPDASSGWSKRVTLYAHQQPSNATSELIPKESPLFIAAETFQGSKDGYIFRNGVEGVGYYKDSLSEGIESADDTLMRNSKMAQEVSFCGSKTISFDHFTKLIKSIRSSDGRVSKRVVIVVENEKMYQKVPPLLGATIVQTKTRSRLGVGSGKNAVYSFARFGQIQEEDLLKEIKATIEQFRVGKIHTLMVTDAQLTRLVDIKSKIQVFIQLTELPDVARYKQRICSILSPDNHDCVCHAFFHKVTTVQRDDIEAFVTSCHGKVISIDKEVSSSDPGVVVK